MNPHTNVVTDFESVVSTDSTTIASSVRNSQSPDNGVFQRSPLWMKLVFNVPLHLFTRPFHMPLCSGFPSSTGEVSADISLSSRTLLGCCATLTTCTVSSWQKQSFHTFHRLLQTIKLLTCIGSIHRSPLSHANNQPVLSGGGEMRPAY